jgi:superfamily II DNA or RNA helicase
MSCLETTRERGRLLVQSPTGTGKTLIAHLTIALLAAEVSDRFPRILVVVPTRALLTQHSFDAGWLRRFGLAINVLGPDMPPALFNHLLGSYGVMITTPVTLANRTALLGDDALTGIDCVVFDEIDTYLTVEELEERRDVGPALRACLDHNLPVVGFTGTHLTDTQVEVWRKSGFSEKQAAIPPGWMPFTPTRFVGVRDDLVIAEDEKIRERIRSSYAQLKQELGTTAEVSWSTVRKLARSGDASAASLLLAMTERLQLFESPGSTGAKYEAIVNSAGESGSTLVLTRYRETAGLITAQLSEAGIPALHVDGSMNRIDIERRTAQFRDRSRDDVETLVMTRELGGRGLDFPSASRVVLVSPRSNYQAVAQELARIRSRQADQKQAIIFYYEDTEEAAKGRRLGDSLRRDKYGDDHLFKIDDLPATFSLDAFESRNLRNEESLIPGGRF